MALAAADPRPGAHEDAGKPARTTGACFHCGEALPAEPVRARIAGAEQPFCCSGCAAASAWIQDAGLSDYYSLRTANGARVDLDPAALEVWDAPSVQAEHVREVEGGYEWSSDPRLTLPTMTRMTESQIENLVAGIECPVRAIFADPAQPYLPDDLRRRRVALLPQGELVVIAGGHHLHMQQAVEVAAAIGDFFAG